MSETSSYVKGLAVGTVLGGVIGAGLALFLTPHTGAQNRKIVIKKFNVIKDRFTDISEDMADTVMDIFGEVSEGTISLYNDGRKLFEKQVKSFQNNWDDIDKDKYLDMIDNIGERLAENGKNRAEDIEDLQRYWRKNWRKMEASMNKAGTAVKTSKPVKAIAEATK